MSSLVTIHVVAGVVLVIASLAVGCWGLSRPRQQLREARWYAQTVQVTHSLVLATGLVGVLLLGQGLRPADPLHARVYGPFMLVAIVAGYAYRTKLPRQNVRLFAVVALVIAALGARAIVTGA